MDLPKRPLIDLADIIPLEHPGPLQTYVLPVAMTVAIALSLFLLMCAFLPFNCGRRPMVVFAAIVMLFGGVAFASEDLGYLGIWFASLLLLGRIARFKGMASRRPVT